MVTEEPNISDTSRLGVMKAAHLLGISRSTLNRACKAGTIQWGIAQNGKKFFIGKHIKKYWLVNV